MSTTASAADSRCSTVTSGNTVAPATKSATSVAAASVSVDQPWTGLVASAHDGQCCAMPSNSATNMTSESSSLAPPRASRSSASPSSASITCIVAVARLVLLVRNAAYRTAASDASSSCDCVACMCANVGRAPSTGTSTVRNSADGFASSMRPSTKKAVPTSSSVPTVEWVSTPRCFTDASPRAAHR